MKNFLVGVVVTLALTFSAAQAGLWEKLSTMNLPVVQAKQYVVEAAGWNLRIYSWIDPINNEKCTFAAGTKKGGLSCSSE